MSRMDTATSESRSSCGDNRPGPDGGPHTASVTPPQPDRQSLTVNSRPDSAGAVVAAVGDLDFETVGTLRDLMQTVVLNPGDRLTLDLAGVEFFDSSGLGALLQARSLALAAGATLVLLPPPEHIVRVLDAVGLTDLFA
jgi:anti-sigma B factor antagonist